MCVLTVSMWLLTIIREFSSIISFWRAVTVLPRGNSTVVSKDGHSFKSISTTRLIMVELTTLFRVWVTLSLGYSGIAWLTNTVSVTKLVLSAVSLQSMLYVDDIIFESLAPQRLKSVVAHFASSPLPLPPVTEWKGLDVKVLSLFLGLVCTLVTVWLTLIIPFEHRLRLADDALCAGELDFVYTVGKTGIPAWSTSSSYDNPGSDEKARSFGTGQWHSDDDPTGIIDTDKESLNFIMAVVDSLVDGYGTHRVSRNNSCGDPIKFSKQNQTSQTPYCESGYLCDISYCEAQYYVGMFDIYGNVVEPYSREDLYCCLSEQIITPNIIGGKFSLDNIQSETTSTAMNIWNAGCANLLGPQQTYDDGKDIFYFSFHNLMAGAYSDVFEGTCGVCPSHIPYCDPIFNECTNITCAELANDCFEDSTAGVRARQFCPITCGCHNPLGQLVLSSPEFGCPSNCGDFIYYDEAVSVIECVDQPIGSNLTANYLNEVTRISSIWPAFWQDTWVHAFVPYILEHGCTVVTPLKLDKALPIDLCVEGGTTWPIKPMSYLCPVACGCSSEMIWGCPSSCVVNVTS